MTSRRKALALLGGGVILAATSGSAAFLATRAPTRARAPWAAAGGYPDPRRNALSYALLAPNPHNRQPWVAELRGDDTVILHRDTSLNLPHTDPFDRQLTIGMGCFLELMVIAAADTGHAVDLDLFPDGESGPTARAVFRAAAGATDPLFAHVMERRSCKEPFVDRPVPGGMARTLSAFADIHTDPETVATLKTLTWEAFQIEATTPRTWKESIDLLRIGKAEINTSPDGISLSGLLFDTLGPLGMMDREAMLSTETSGFRQTLDRYHGLLTSTPAYAVIRTDGNSRQDQIIAGRRWLRLNLATTALGLALHPVSQALQEYPEMSRPYEQAHELLADPGETVQMLGRLGYGPQTPVSPRWPLDAKLKPA